MGAKGKAGSRATKSRASAARSAGARRTAAGTPSVRPARTPTTHTSGAAAPSTAAAPSIPAASSAPAARPAEVPRAVRLACGILALEALAFASLAVLLLVKTVTGNPDNLARALLEVAMAAAGAAVVGLGARALYRLNASARTPVVMIQLLALPVSYSLGFQAGLIGYGGPIMLAALAVLYLLFTPPARAAFDRNPFGKT